LANAPGNSLAGGVMLSSPAFSSMEEIGSMYIFVLYLGYYPYLNRNV
jgi:hypothetical protein